MTVLLPVCLRAQNVGIATPDPLNKLHVEGGFRLDTLIGVNGEGLMKHDASRCAYGIKFTGSTRPGSQWFGDQH